VSRTALGVLGVAVGIAGVAVIAQQDKEQSSSGATTSSQTRVIEVIDGDTLVVASGAHVRLIGIDTPERHECGYQPAADALRTMVEGRKVTLVNPESVQDEDRYARLLRYVDRSGRDAGYVLLERGLAVARYDSQDGYDHHPRQGRYRAADKAVASICH
jgi:endonuclease YncB( thermonuclease family)